MERRKKRGEGKKEKRYCEIHNYATNVHVPYPPSNTLNNNIFRQIKTISLHTFAFMLFEHLS